MTNLEHSVGVNEVNLVERRLKLAQGEQADIMLFLAEINEILGVDKVHYDEYSQQLFIAYDATHCSLVTIEKIMENYDIDWANTWWNRVKQSYYKFVDQNLKDNANHQATCCHQVPPGVNKKGRSN